MMTKNASLQTFIFIGGGKPMLICEAQLQWL